MQQALEMYYNEFNSYPASLAAGGTIGSTTVYMKIVPTPPTPTDGSCGPQPAYTYAQQSSSSYTINYCLGAAVSNESAGLNTATAAGM